MCSRTSNNTNNSLKRKRLSGNITDAVATNLPARKIVKVMSALPQRLTNDNTTQKSPQHVLESIMIAKRAEANTYSYEQILENDSAFFCKATPADIESWDFDVLKAVREGDVDTLREMHESGRRMTSRNKFGESLLHLACRK